MSTEDLKNLLVHLRLHFQLLLAPVFLWGWLASGGGLSRQMLVAFVAFHIFLYSGATAFNSYYDHDTGPVGGLEHPPSVSPALLPFSLVIQTIGWALAATVNTTFFLAYAAFVVLSVAYSHPRVRLKAHTVASVIVVGLGQGALAFLAAWAAARGEIGSALRVDGLLAAATAVLLILALYPLTQVYQIEEDRTRGDRGMAVAWGARRCFAFALACTMLGGLTMLVWLVRRFGWQDALVVGAGLAVQLVAIGWLAGQFEPQSVIATYRRVMRLNACSATALSAYLVARLVSGGS